jgi:Cof subfamily protein (haloacid dehalogenase superfamily)
MELIVFDLDGTLLNRESQISDYTRETLVLLAQRNIAYTVATGRALHGSRDILAGHNFKLPQVYKNGAMIWLPEYESYSRKLLLTSAEIKQVLNAFVALGVAPFIYTLNSDNSHAVYHPALKSDAETNWLYELSNVRGLASFPLSELPGDAEITNISAMGPRTAIEAVRDLVDTQEDHLVAYMGSGIVEGDVCWLDIHHTDGSKGGAVAQLKQDLGFERVVCFGDSDNDLSMFEAADEAYAPDNAKDEIKKAATKVIGHHNEDGIARFLRERFELS